MAETIPHCGQVYENKRQSVIFLSHEDRAERKQVDWRKANWD